MQVESFDPAQLIVSDRALKHIQRQLQKESARAVVINIVETGCNGYMYELNYADDTVDQQENKIFQFEDEVTVVVANEHWPMLQGTEIDYVTEGLNSSLKFNNPNADLLCGCGESFSVRGT